MPQIRGTGHTQGLSCNHGAPFISQPNPEDSQSQGIMRLQSVPLSCLIEHWDKAVRFSITVGALAACQSLLVESICKKKKGKPRKQNPAHCVSTTVHNHLSMRAAFQRENEGVCQVRLLEPLKQPATSSWKGCGIPTVHMLCTTVFIAALFTIAEKRNQSSSPLVDEWMWEIRYTHTMKLFSSVKKTEIRAFAWKWMKLEILMLSQIC